MSQEFISQGQDFVITQHDRSFGGRSKEVFWIDGIDGKAAFSSDVSINGSLTLNGRKITWPPPGSGAPLQFEVLARPLKLSKVPFSNVLLFVNGQLQDANDFSVTADGTVIWRSPDFDISPLDKVEAAYEA